MPDRFLLAGAGDDCLLLAGGTHTDCLLLGESAFDGALRGLTVRYFDGLVYQAVEQDIVGPIRIRAGMKGTGPRDRVPAVGTMTFSLADEDGRYTPPGAFRRGRRIYLDLSPAGETTRRFIGRISRIDPPTDPHGPRLTDVECTDWLERAATIRVRPPVQRGRRAGDLMRAVIDEMPAAHRDIGYPAANTGTLTAPYAFHEVGAGVAARTLLARIAASESGRLWLRGANLALEDRLGTLAGRREWSVRAEDVAPGGVRIADASADAYTRIEATVHPLHIDAARRVLHDLVDRPTIEAGATERVLVPLQNPDVGGQAIGGFDLGGHTVTAEDGAGADASAAITLTVEQAGGTAIVDIENTGAAAATITGLQVRGRGVYDLTPVTIIADAADEAGADVPETRAARIDLRYVTRPESGRVIADLLLARHASTDAQIQRVVIPGARSAAMTGLLAQAEPGDRVMVEVPQTDRTALATLYGLDLIIEPTLQMRGTLTVGPAFDATRFRIGTSELGGSDVLG